MKPSYRNFFHHFAVAWVCVCMILPTPVLLAQAPAIVPDGRTQTTVTSNAAGTMTDVRTNTVKGINAYNSFERFNVPGGNTTNLHVPNAAKNLVNLVHNERSQIDGILNSYKNGQIGGNVYFLNPRGIVIGQGGVVNVGSLHLQTPTTDYMAQLLNERGEISAIHEQMLFSGNVPISPSGVISVKGKINAVEEIQLSAGDVELARTANLRAGRQVQVDFSDMVYTVEDKFAKVSVVGVGMRSYSGVAAKTFTALSNAGINIQMVSTSEIKISCLVGAEDANKAVQALHSQFL
jgi:filamentous hemagglutinin family protein